MCVKVPAADEDEPSMIPNLGSISRRFQAMT
jgi:hypothetical protein